MSNIINNCLVETYKHTQAVRRFMNLFIHDLINRSEHHDDTKFVEPELTPFAELTAELSGVEYGSPEYAAQLEKLKPCLEHHYSKNRHHTEFFEDGINGMTLVDLIEMISDWRAATERNKAGNIRKSLDINANKYGMTLQLKKIFENTIREYFKD